MLKRLIKWWKNWELDPFEEGSDEAERQAARLKFKNNPIKPLSNSEILQRVEEKELIKRCVNSGVCPYCGQDLKITGDDNFLDKECFICNISWPYV